VDYCFFWKRTNVNVDKKIEEREKKKDKQTTDNRYYSEANGSGIFSQPFSRFPFQFFVHEQSSPTKRFPLQSGLERKQIAYLETVRTGRDLSLLKHLFIRSSRTSSEMHNPTKHKSCFFKNVHHRKIIVIGVGFEAVDIVF